MSYDTEALESIGVSEKEKATRSTRLTAATVAVLLVLSSIVVYLLYQAGVKTQVAPSHHDNSVSAKPKRLQDGGINNKEDGTTMASKGDHTRKAVNFPHSLRPDNDEEGDNNEMR